MAQQMKNSSQHMGSVTITQRDTYRYAVVNPPFTGKHMKPQTPKYKANRKAHWALRNAVNNLKKEIENADE